MRWFKHITAARNDPFVRELMYKFGADGYVAWFGTIEIIAESLTPKRIKRGGKIVETWCKESPRFFSEQLLIDTKILKKVYEFIRFRKKGRFIERDNLWTVDIPKVLEFMDEWMERVLKETRELVGSSSGKQSRAEAEQSSMLAMLEEGGDTGRTPGAAGLALLAKEFTAITGKAAFAKVRNIKEVLETLETLVGDRGTQACLFVMKEKIAECRQRSGKPPTSLKYFIPVFRDDMAFKNGSATHDAPKAGEARPISSFLPPLPGGKAHG